MPARPPGLDRVVADLQRMARILNARISNLAVLIGLVKIYSDQVAWTITATTTTGNIVYNFPAGTFATSPAISLTVQSASGAAIGAAPLLVAASAASITWRVDLKASGTSTGFIHIIAAATQ